MTVVYFGRGKVEIKREEGSIRTSGNDSYKEKAEIAFLCWFGGGWGVITTEAEKDRKKEVQEPRESTAL